MIVPYVPPWKKKPLFNRWSESYTPDPSAGKINPWLGPIYGNVEGGEMMPKSPSWTGRPSGIDGGLVAGNARVASGTTIPQTKKKSNKLKYIVEALQELEGPTPTPLAAGRNVGASGIQYTPTDMGAYVGDPVARQTAMAKARMEEDLQRRKKLLGGGY